MSYSGKSFKVMTDLFREQLRELDALEAKKVEIRSFLNENAEPLLSRFRSFVLQELKTAAENDTKTVLAYKSLLLRNFGIGDSWTHAGLTDDQLFRWTNSRPGRHYADAAYDWDEDVPEEDWTNWVTPLLPSNKIEELEAEARRYSWIG